MVSNPPRRCAPRVEKLDASNRLYAIVQAMAGIDPYPDRVSNIEMGYLFEHLVMRFNEQANEEAGVLPAQFGHEPRGRGALCRQPADHHPPARLHLRGAEARRRHAKVFDSVIIITDRRVLDQQLQNTVYQFEHKSGVVEKIDEDTRRLAKALSGGTPIIISTIQKVPFIAQAIRTLEQRGERFGTDLTDAEQLFFDQVRATAERDEKIAEAAKANIEANFAACFGRIPDDLFIQRMEGNDEIFNRVMNDQKFRGVAQEHLAREVYERVSKGEGPPSP
jgi:type I restriction enzyme R subunit